MLKLKDETLLRADAYVDGSWAAASSGGRFAVTNKATGEVWRRSPISPPSTHGARSKRQMPPGRPGGQGPPKSVPD